MVSKDDLIIKFLAGRHGKLLDVGGGEGHLRKLLTNGVVYLNIDWNRKADVIFDLNAGKLPFENKEFDIVVCSEVFEHLFSAKQILKEITRVLKDDGVAVVTLPNEYNLYLRIRYLLGFNTNHNAPFQGDGEQHIHLPRIKDIERFISSELEIKEKQAIFVSHKKYFIDSFINVLAGLYPSLFAKNLILKCGKRTKEAKE